MNLAVPEHGDILDTRQSMRGPMLAAIALHASLILTLALSNWIGRTESFGASDVAGGAVAVQAVNSIPIQHHGPENPLANDSKSEVPQTPAKPVERAQEEKPKPDAIALKMREPKKKLAEVASERQLYRPYKQLQPNQETSKQAPQVSNPMYSAQQGSGNVGTGAHTTLGTRFAAYGTQVQQIVASNWHTADVDAKYQTAPTVIATFELMRDGSVRNAQILQSSGIPSLDFSVRRAILDSRFPPIPQGFDKDYATVEFWFELKR
ncbi:MAG: TonB family protein [Bryobacteraceae bacterium]